MPAPPPTPVDRENVPFSLASPFRILSLRRRLFSVVKLTEDMGVQEVSSSFHTFAARPCAHAVMRRTPLLRIGDSFQGKWPVNPSFISENPDTYAGQDPPCSPPALSYASYPSRPAPAPAPLQPPKLRLGSGASSLQVDGGILPRLFGGRERTLRSRRKSSQCCVWRRRHLGDAPGKVLAPLGRCGGGRQHRSAKCDRCGGDLGRTCW